MSKKRTRMKPFTDGFCQTDLKYSIFDAEKHAKKTFGKIDF